MLSLKDRRIEQCLEFVPQSVVYWVHTPFRVYCADLYLWIWAIQFYNQYLFFFFQKEGEGSSYLCTFKKKRACCWQCERFQNPEGRSSASLSSMPSSLHDYYLSHCLLHLTNLHCLSSQPLLSHFRSQDNHGFFHWHDGLLESLPIFVLPRSFMRPCYRAERCMAFTSF